MSFLIKPGRMFLALECAALFGALPVALYFYPSRLYVHLSLWGLALYAAIILNLMPGFSWRAAWRGVSWTRRDKILVALRFVISTIGIIFLTICINPSDLFAFPTQRPIFWFLVMLLYPLLSALPQELVFRSFFSRRYATIFPNDRGMLAVSAFLFGFIHIVFHNPVSPLLSLLCGFFLAGSYLAHRSLKYAALEHALYGDMVFTVGLGYYFLVGHYVVR